MSDAPEFQQIENGFKDDSTQQINNVSSNGDESGFIWVFNDGQLSFVGQDAESIPEQLINEYAAVTQRLDLSYNCLRSLDGLEKFANLQELILDRNEIDDAVLFPDLKNLHTLTLNKNKIQDLNGLLGKISKSLPSLKYLSLLGNIACPNQLSNIDKDEEDYQRYRYFVLYQLSNLKFLDSTPVSSDELMESKRVGPYMQVVRATEDEIQEGEENDTLPYSPLPESKRKQEDHKGTFGKSKYVYYGRHSEGNRFIKNKDL